MKYSFSSQFLKILHPDTNFGEAWESLCHDLLVADTGDRGIMRLTPPDRGVDLLRQSTGRAYQCKSSERGADGSLNGDDSVSSLEMALVHRAGLAWAGYIFATNANHTGAGIEKIKEFAHKQRLAETVIEFLGPKYWSDLCEKWIAVVKHRLDYRICFSEEEVIEAFRKAQYFDKYLTEYKEAISDGNFKVVIKNNRTPLELEIPFSPDLTVENCVDVAQQLLGISLEWTNYLDLGTSAGPSVSLTVDQKALGFSQKVKDLTPDVQGGLQLWITIVWEDKRRSQAQDGDRLLAQFLLRDALPVARGSLTRDERRKETVDRTESLLQARMWKSMEDRFGGRSCRP